MEISLKYNDPNSQPFKVEFTTEAAVHVPNLLLLIATFDTKRWIINCPTSSDIQTDPISEYKLRPIKFIVNGYYYHNDKKVNGQLVYFLRRVGSTGFDFVFIPTGLDSLAVSSHSTMYEKHTYHIIDLDGFNYARKLLKQKEYSLEEYIASRMASPIADDIGITMEDQTSLFSITPNKFDANNLMTSNGLRIFLEEQNNSHVDG